MPTDTQHQIALTLVPGVGSILIRQLISYCGSATEVFRSPLARLLKVPGIGEVTARAVLKPGVLSDAEQVMLRLEKLGASALFYTDKAYPGRLKSLYDAPALLYFQGTGNLNAPRTIGLVGTRQATEYGRRITHEIIEAITPYGVSVISGLAYGIDIAAHRSSLANGLPTLGVMASGLDIIYPNVHQKTATDMLMQGGLLTESKPGTKPDAHLFPARNRIIAGLSDVVVVVEAAAKGGALITAEYANNYHREVFAVPGQLNQAFSAGCNKLIRENKAQIYTSPKDIIEALNWDRAHEPVSPKNIPSALPVDITEEESQILALLRQSADLHVDELSWKSQIPMGRLASLLLTLEFQGFIRSLPGKKYAVVYV
ncbi:DNA-processing protein DprA [Spirosoma radiotolerans]|uniref:DNA processing protein DprA n=1 Tax=Spirosoma radiotolerans TaxID=1379870 RepID=A0A0E3ZVL7_9BACT|nr:DNA-processing protein DprA [Spirosoma radiotolerans]AKD55200.1 DNA processing protein DprA [Spirosoma radiotolerans]